MKFYGDSVSQYQTSGNKFTSYGTYTLSEKDSAASYNFIPGKNQSITGKKLHCSFTKETFYSNDGEFIVIPKLLHRGEIENIVTNDSIFFHIVAMDYLALIGLNKKREHTTWHALSSLKLKPKTYYGKITLLIT